MADTIDGISEKALGEFLSEAQEIVETLNRDVLQLDADLKRGARDPDLINRIFRSAHSLKGLSGMFGAKNMSDLAHTLENLLDGMRLGRVTAASDVIDVLFESIELFNRFIAESSGGPKVSKKVLQDIGERLESLLASPSAKGAQNPLSQVEIDPAILSVLTEYEEYRLIDNVRQGVSLVKVHASFDLMSFDESLAKLTTDLKALGEVITTLPSSDGGSEQGIDFDIIVGSREPFDVLQSRFESPEVRLVKIERQAFKAAEAGASAGPEPAAAKEPNKPPKNGSAAAAAARAPTEQSAPPPGKDAPQTEERQSEGDLSLRSVSQTVRVDIKRLDSLMNTVGELVLVRTAMQGISDHLRADLGFTGLAVDLFKEARNFERKLNELQQGIMDVRMVPLGQNFEKLSRMVRKLSRSAGKEIELRITGADTELDKLIVEDLADPLMHLLRNAIDHGIEHPEERISAGKSMTGRIDVNAYQKGNHVVIEISDDGRGVDIGRVKRKATEVGLVDPDRLDEMTKRDALNLLFLPGFSTTSEVSEMSGRGVGLDVVKTNIANLSGMIDIQTEPSKGTRFVITLPITLAIIRALVIKTADRIYTIPLNSVVEIISVQKNRIRTIERREVLELRGTTLPLLRLNVLFLLGQAQAEQDGMLFVVVVGLAENRLGIVVDELIGQQDIVIKPLGRSLAQVPGIAGATNLANQQTVLVLDVGALIEETLVRE